MTTKPIVSLLLAATVAAPGLAVAQRAQPTLLQSHGQNHVAATGKTVRKHGQSHPHTSAGAQQTRPHD
ncbi:MAG: hypothetical protein JO111_04485 [Caulobacteraceae bacterium]|nr:hypothetical protein [Caulobacteraceae bacterium]